MEITGKYEPPTFGRSHAPEENLGFFVSSRGIRWSQGVWAVVYQKMTKTDKKTQQKKFRDYGTILIGMAFIWAVVCFGIFFFASAVLIGWKAAVHLLN